MHLPESFLPYYTGGKEVFVAHLAKELQKMGHENRVVIHADNRIPAHVAQYEYNGIPVHVLPAVKVTHTQYWRGEASPSDDFEELLKQYQPDVVHFHDQSGGASLSHLHIVKRLGIKTLLTYHSPGQSCPQRALLYKGKYLCDGKLNVRRCTECLYSCKGLPGWVSNLLSQVPITNSNMEKSRLLRLIHLSSSVKNFIDSFHETYTLHDGVQIHARWIRPLLVSNEVDEHKIFYADLAILKPEGITDGKKNTSPAILKLLYVGRCSYIKGVHLLIEAVRLLPKDFPVEVHFLGPYWDNTTYGRKMLRRIRGDRRFREPILLEPQQVVSYMQDMDAVVVPSIWPETGPLVVLEAFHAGVPVIGTRAAGIAERIEHLKNGLLFEWGNTRQLAQCIELLYQRKREGVKFDIPQPRGIEQMALQILNIYRSL